MAHDYFAANFPVLTCCFTPVLLFENRLRFGDSDGVMENSRISDERKVLLMNVERL